MYDTILPSGTQGQFCYRAPERVFLPLERERERERERENMNITSMGDNIPGLCWMPPFASDIKEC